MQEETISGYLFLSPNLLGFLIFFAGPLLLSLYVSFTNWDAFGTRDWVGLDNYAKIFNITVKTLATPDQLASEVMDVKIYDEVGRINLLGLNILFGAADKLFWLALRNTLTFVFLAVPLSVGPALLLAAVLNSKLPGMQFYRTIYFIPSIAAVVGISLVWQWLYNSAIGWINYLITSSLSFISGILGLAIADPQIRWLSSVDTALFAVIIVSVWQTMGFNSVLFLAGLQNIPGELYEAATVDGANDWNKFWSITLPMLAPTTFFVVSTTIIQALQVFEQVYVMTSATGSDAGGPSNSTLTLVLYLYQTGFRDFEQGYASAVAWVLFAVIFIFTLAQFQRQRQSGLYEN
jgi:ABC-type sugar transport system permease subunit